MKDLAFRSAFELADAVRNGELAPTALVQACLDRIDALNPALNAFVALRREEALEEAAVLQRQIVAGKRLGPLAGLPVGVKDLEDATGLPTTYGSRPFRDYRPTRDSVQVARLRTAGAIVLGKTNTPEFGYTGLTKNLLFGVTRNPWNLERTPGGSSGGSSAAIASGMVPLVTASDGGGSIRIPACYVGAYGLKPSFGRVPVGPLIADRPMLPWIDTVCYGPLTRTVRDAALFLDVVAGPDPSDPETLPPPGLSYVDTLEQLPARLRIAVSPGLGYARVQRDVRREVEAAIDVFRALGHEVEIVDDVFPDLGAEWAAVSAAETYGLLAESVEAHRGEWGRAFYEGLQQGKAVTPAFIARVQRKRAALQAVLARLFERCALLLTPTLPTEAFAAAGPFPETIDGAPIGSALGAVAFTYPFNFSGHPAASVRAGFTDAGLPAGLQIVGPRFRDDLVLQASYAYEQARPWNDRWPELAA
ncbi:MAG: amidase [Deltaproteobacteria bacterium]|nr:amidase [Deltaproteobacteria bacterium]